MWCTTSAQRNSASSAGRLSGDLMSSAIARLPRWQPANGQSAHLIGSPVVASTLITSAPRSASSIGPSGPARKFPKSRTLSPSSGNRAGSEFDDDDEFDRPAVVAVDQDASTSAVWAPAAGAAQRTSVGGSRVSGRPGTVIRPASGSSRSITYRFARACWSARIAPNATASWAGMSCSHMLRSHSSAVRRVNASVIAPQFVHPGKPSPAAPVFNSAINSGPISSNTSRISGVSSGGGGMMWIHRPSRHSNSDALMLSFGMPIARFVDGVSARDQCIIIGIRAPWARLV